MSELSDYFDPGAAITLAAVAIHDVDCPDRTCSGSALGHCYRLARAAIEAVTPALQNLVDDAWLEGWRGASAAALLHDLTEEAP